MEAFLTADAESRLTEDHFSTDFCKVTHTESFQTYLYLSIWKLLDKCFRFDSAFANALLLSVYSSALCLWAHSSCHWFVLWASCYFCSLNLYPASQRPLSTSSLCTRFLQRPLHHRPSSSQTLCDLTDRSRDNVTAVSWRCLLCKNTFMPFHTILSLCMKD